MYYFVLRGKNGVVNTNIAVSGKGSIAFPFWMKAPRSREAWECISFPSGKSVGKVMSEPWEL